MVKAAILSLATWLLAGAALAEPMLYDTGPGVPTGYVRFLNAAGTPIAIAAGGKEMALDSGIFSRFQTVPSGTEQRATAAAGDARQAIQVTVQTGEFVTIALFAEAPPLVIRNLPAEFNALKADIAFLNADPGCPAATMRAGAKKTIVFDNIAAGAMARRLVNPAAAQIEAACGTVPVSGMVDLGVLAPRNRYSIAVIPDGAGGHRLIGGQDEQPRYE